ncbi:MAG TPA: hypothetical protein PK556_12115, partial [Smithellaceae bacterium]|nr:hypothetical protein [Smithellaceae bacterium]
NNSGEGKARRRVERLRAFFYRPWLKNIVPSLPRTLHNYYFVLARSEATWRSLQTSNADEIASLRSQ